MSELCRIEQALETERELLEASLAVLRERMRPARLLARATGAVRPLAAMVFGHPSETAAPYRAEALARWEDDGGPPDARLDDPDGGWLTKALALRQSALRQLVQIDAAERRGLLSARAGAQLRDEVTKALVRDTTEVLVEGLDSLETAASSRIILARERAYLAALPDGGAAGPPLAATAVVLAGVGAALAFLMPGKATKARRFTEGGPA